MLRLRGVVRALGAIALGSCGDDEPTTDAGACWPLSATPGGQVELGTGDRNFEPMPAVVTIIRDGSQGDPFLQIHGRIRGMPPGNPEGDFFDPRNPKTKVRVVIDDVGLVLGVDCPASIPYVATADPDAFEMLHSLRLGFGLFPIYRVSGKQARITIEVVGSNGLYASDEKLVVLRRPPTHDAGVPDTALDD